MEFMRDSTKCGVSVIKLTSKSLIFVPTTVVGVYLIVKVRVIDMELVWTNANDWAMNSVKVLDFEQKLTTLDDVVISFIVDGDCSQSWSWNLGQWTEIETVDNLAENVDDEGGGKGPKR